MSNKYKRILNAPLAVGDPVVCGMMDTNFTPVTPGTIGTVTSVGNGPYNEILYFVEWKSGSKLPLIDGVDSWFKLVKTEISESYLFIKTKKQIINELKNKL